MALKRNVETQWWQESYPLTADDELDLVDIIHAGIECEEGTQKYIAAQEAVDTLVSAYSPLIEKIARERMSSRGNYGHSAEDFIAEAYVIAVQCAHKFDPYKSSKPIRFSSYVSRAISSSLSRLSVKTHSSASIPVTTLSKARQWSHVYHDMLSKGIEPVDEEVSEICGVDFTQAEVVEILSATIDEDIDNAYNIGVKDANRRLSQNSYEKDIDYGVDMVYGDFSATMKALLGIGYSHALMTPFAMRTETSGIEHDDVEEFFKNKDELLYHPRFRKALAHHMHHRIFVAGDNLTDSDSQEERDTNKEVKEQGR